MIQAVLYDIINDKPLSFDNMVSEMVYPERTNPDFKYFVSFEPFAEQEYDQRLINFKKTQTPVNEPHPDYPIYWKWLIEYEYLKKPQEEVFFSIENARRVANATLIDNDLYAMGIGIAIKKLKNGLPTEEEEQIMLDIVDIHNRIMQNYQNEIDLKAAWLNNENINIDEGWERN